MPTMRAVLSSIFSSFFTAASSSTPASPPASSCSASVSSSSISPPRRKRQRVASSFLLDVLTSPDIGACVLAFLDAAALTSVASVNAALHALIDSNAGVWGELLLAERPHLAPLLPLLGPGGNAAKALYRERMVLDGKGRPLSTPSEEQELARLREQLASVFMYVELRTMTTNNLLGSCAMPLWEGDVLGMVFDDGVEVVLQEALPLDEFERTVELVEVVDLGKKAFQCTLTGDTVDWDANDGSYSIYFDGLSDLFAPEEFFGDEGRLFIFVFENIVTDTEGRVTRFSFRFEAWHDGSELEGGLDKWQLLEMMLERKITIK